MCCMLMRQRFRRSHPARCSDKQFIYVAIQDILITIDLECSNIWRPCEEFDIKFDPRSNNTPNTFYSTHYRQRWYFRAPPHGLVVG